MSETQRKAFTVGNALCAVVSLLSLLGMLASPAAEAGRLEARVEGQRHAIEQLQKDTQDRASLREVDGLRDDLKDFRTELRAGIVDLRAEQAEMRRDLRELLKQVREKS